MNKLKVKNPNVGESIFAICIQDDAYIGETLFLCSTQEHAVASLAQAKKEIQDFDEEEYDPENGGTPVIFEMIRRV